jgi:hypothetical protein
MRFRKLRIAWSVLCGIVCLLLIILWVRSYGQDEHVQFQFVYPQLFAHSVQGLFCIGVSSNSFADHVFYLNGQSNATNEVRARDLRAEYFQYTNAGGFGVLRSPQSFVILAPHWIYVALAGGLAASPWIPSRFSLRTLLIATTLLALILGTIIATTR